MNRLLHNSEKSQSQTCDLLCPGDDPTKRLLRHVKTRHILRNVTKFQLADTCIKIKHTIENRNTNDIRIPSCRGKASGLTVGKGGCAAKVWAGGTVADTQNGGLVALLHKIFKLLTSKSVHFSSLFGQLKTMLSSPVISMYV